MVGDRPLSPASEDGGVGEVAVHVVQAWRKWALGHVCSLSRGGLTSHYRAAGWSKEEPGMISF
ncbi:hypothetical protein Acsp05_18130 [Actinokineospora sp. NBRC 105648]|nr:hypothetical protein Acsp05_18130 [Actinokineospora sp. NBRC 105648]